MFLIQGTTFSVKVVAVECRQTNQSAAYVVDLPIGQFEVVVRRNRVFNVIPLGKPGQHSLATLRSVGAYCMDMLGVISKSL